MELIDKKPLLVSLVDWQMGQFSVVGHEREYNLLDSIIKGIENVPTVEAKEVVHGEWIKSQAMPLSAECSECKCWITRHSVNELWFRYCPHCGADMRKKV